MAATLEARRLTEAHRLVQARLGAQIVEQIIASWPLLDLDNLDSSFERWLRTVMPLIRSQRALSARLGANYLDRYKKLELGPTARLPLLLADQLPVEAVTTSLLVTGPLSIKSAMTRGVNLATASENALTRASGAALRHVLDGGRSTITDTIAADRQALGYARATSGRPCHFCAMLASRGPVYKSEATGGFKPHDACHCEPEPVYRDDTAWPPGAERFRALWNEAKAADGDTTANFRRLLEAA